MRALFYAVLSLVISFGIASAGALDNTGIGTKALSMQSAFAGVADDPSAIYYNPAGLAFLPDDDWRFQIYHIAILADFVYRANGREDVSDKMLHNPGMFLSKKVDKWAFGYGCYIPYAGGGQVFKKFQGTRYNIEGFEAYIANTLTVAHQFSPKFSLGGGLSLYYGTLESKVFQFAEITSEYEGMAGYGFNLGAMVKPTDNFSIGLQVKSSAKMKMDGEVTVRKNPFNMIPEGDSEIELTIPYYYILGLGYKPTRKLTLAFEACYMEWGDMDHRKITTWIDRDDAITPAITVKPRTFYQDCWRICWGLEYQMNEKLALLCGMKFTERGTKRRGLDVSNDVDILIPTACDVNLLSNAVGFTYDFTEHFELNFSVFYVRGFEEEYNGKFFDDDVLSFLLGADFTF